MPALVCATLLISLVATGCSEGFRASGLQSGLDGGELVAEKCTQCHSLDRIQGARKSEADWDATVSRMQGNGLKITDAEKAAIVGYLAKTYGQ
jgi:hypothetical protein